MRVYYYIVGACWTTFFAIWLIAALRRGTGRSGYSPGAMGLRVALAVAIAVGVVVGNEFRFPFGELAQTFAIAGCALCIAGLAFAVWARVTLGRSWGMPMTQHAAPELVTAGPYRYVRHPIYTGVSAMAIGTALVFPQAVLWAVIMMVYFVVGARREERDMARQFPNAYPEYRRRSKMIVPFVL